MSTFFTSDSHFGHKNIIQYCNRPFTDCVEMDQAMINLWNSVVGPRDVVYHLGDFSMLPPEKISAILQKLNGIKRLVIGNHDKNPLVIPEWASRRSLAEVTVDGHKLFLCHYPMREWPGMWKGVIHLYGHVHGNLMPAPGSMDVGADVWGGKPISLAEILVAMTPLDQKLGNECVPLRLKNWEGGGRFHE